MLFSYADAPGSAPETGSPSSSNPRPRSIPLYNVLWAESSRDQQTLTIDFAEDVSKTQVRAAKISLATASATDDIAKWTAHLLDKAYGPAPRQKRAYVLVNPHAGPGGAQKKWDHQVKPLFDAARMPMTVHTTTKPREAIDLCAKMDIDAFDIVVPCSGDGLSYECFNGLGKRPDARRALQQVAVAHVPCGSGNALALNAFGTHRASLAALAIVKGVPTPMDLISITQDAPAAPGPTRSLSFLSQTLGVMAEADLGTEHLRWMGEHRFTYGSIKRILKKKLYPCDLWVKMEIDHKDDVREHYRRERGNSSLAELDKMTTSTSTRVGRDSEAVSEAEATKDGEGLPPLRYGTVGDKLPEGWVKIPADEIGTIYAGNVSCSLPHAPTADALGKLTLVAARLHGPRRHLPQRRPPQRRPPGRVHRRRRRAHPQGPRAPGRDLQPRLLRPRPRQVLQGLGVPHRAQVRYRRGRGRFHQRRRRVDPVRALPGRGASGPGNDHYETGGDRVAWTERVGQGDSGMSCGAEGLAV